MHCFILLVLPDVLNHTNSPDKFLYLSDFKLVLLTYFMSSGNIGIFADKSRKFQIVAPLPVCRRRMLDRNQATANGEEAGSITF